MVCPPPTPSLNTVFVSRRDWTGSQPLLLTQTTKRLRSIRLTFTGIWEKRNTCRDPAVSVLKDTQAHTHAPFFLLQTSLGAAPAFVARLPTTISIRRVCTGSNIRGSLCTVAICRLKKAFTLALEFLLRCILASHPNVLFFTYATASNGVGIVIDRKTDRLVDVKEKVVPPERRTWQGVGFGFKRRKECSREAMRKLEGKKVLKGQYVRKLVLACAWSNSLEMVCNGVVLATWHERLVVRCNTPLFFNPCCIISLRCRCQLEGTEGCFKHSPLNHITYYWWGLISTRQGVVWAGRKCTREYMGGDTEID